MSDIILSYCSYGDGTSIMRAPFFAHVPITRSLPWKTVLFEILFFAWGRVLCLRRFGSKLPLYLASELKKNINWSGNWNISGYWYILLFFYRSCHFFAKIGTAEKLSTYVYHDLSKHDVCTVMFTKI